MPDLTADEKEFAAAVKLLDENMKQLSNRVKELAVKVKKADDEDKEYTPWIRFAMTLAAQIAGFFLLWLLGSNTFSIDAAVDQPSIREGLEYIQGVERIYMAGSGIIILIVGLLWWRYEKAEDEKRYHFYVDIILRGFVLFDLVLLTFLVCQEGGLCRSMFLPVYFLIPTAYLTAERHNKKYRKYKLIILSLILGCIYISYRYAAWAQPPQSGSGLQPASGTFNLLGWWRPVNLTDFSTLAHRDYDEAVWYASCISALVPIIQNFSLLFLDKLKEKRQGSKEGSDHRKDKETPIIG